MFPLKSMISSIVLLKESVGHQHSGGVVAYLHRLGAAHQEVQDPVAHGGVQTQGHGLNDWMVLGGYYGVEG